MLHTRWPHLLYRSIQHFFCAHTHKQLKLGETHCHFHMDLFSLTITCTDVKRCGLLLPFPRNICWKKTSSPHLNHVCVLLSYLSIHPYASLFSNSRLRLLVFEHTVWCKIRVGSFFFLPDLFWYYNIIQGAYKVIYLKVSCHIWSSCSFSKACTITTCCPLRHNNLFVIIFTKNMLFSFEMHSETTVWSL